MEKSMAQYNSNPKLCKLCSSPILYKNRKENIFCSHSCSATYQNERRTPETIEKQRNSIIQTLSKKFPSVKNSVIKIKKIKEEKYPFSKVYYGICSIINLPFYSQYYKKYSSKAAMSDRLIYRRFCDFKFNPYHYPELIGYDLLLKYGLYHPIKNPNGVSRDHLLSVAYGWENKIDPNIISHIANCQLILHVDNQRKKTKSSITLEELLKKMETTVELAST